MLRSVSEEPLPPRKSEPTERELRAMLEGREKEIAARLHGQGKIVSKVLPIVVLSFFAWAAYVYVTSEHDAAQAQETAPPAAPLPAIPTTGVTPMEWPTEAGQAPPAQPANDPNNILTTKTSNKLEHSDMHFAMELMNFMQPGRTHPQPVQQIQQAPPPPPEKK